MKKNFLYIMMMLACVAMPLTSCDNDEPQNEIKGPHDPYSDEDQTPLDGYNSLDYLQNCLVVVGSKGEVLRSVYGKPLDASQPTVLSVPVANLETAEQIFLGWVAPEKEAVKVENGYIYNLTDEFDNAQGSVEFHAVTDEAGVIARMSVGEGTNLKHVSEVNFISYDLWPENDAVAKYEKGKRYVLPCELYTWGFPEGEMEGAAYWEDRWIYIDGTHREYYCIQGNDNGQEAILIWLSPDDEYMHLDDYTYENYRVIDYPLYYRLPTIADAQKVLDIYNSDYDWWKAMLKEMDAAGYMWSPVFGIFTTGNSEFALNSYNKKDGKLAILDLDDKKGKICYASLLWNCAFFYRYMHIRICPPLPNE